MFFLYNIFDLLGWMDTEVFSEWFDKFANSITERPLVLLFDGYMTHTSLPVIQRALNERIIIVKFPPHFMDVFKTSDVLFWPLETMLERNSATPRKFVRSKIFFVQRRFCRSALQDMEVWHDYRKCHWWILLNW